MSDEKKISKPCRFCWHCGRQLQGNHRATKLIRGNLHTFHKSCLISYEREERENNEIPKLSGWTGRVDAHSTEPP